VSDTNLINVPSRADIERLQAALSTLPQYKPETNHYFAHGMYLRTVFSPAGSVIVGKVHKTEHFYAVLTGRVQVTSDKGVLDLNASRDGPQILTSPVGSKRAVYVVEDAWRMTVHLNPDDETDIETVESRLVEDDLLSKFITGNKVLS
jgi:hypothetical protein